MQNLLVLKGRCCSCIFCRAPSSPKLLSRGGQAILETLNLAPYWVLKSCSIWSPAGPNIPLPRHTLCWYRYRYLQMGELNLREWRWTNPGINFNKQKWSFGLLNASSVKLFFHNRDGSIGTGSVLDPYSFDTDLAFYAEYRCGSRVLIKKKIEKKITVKKLQFTFS